MNLPNYGEVATCRDRLAKYCVGNGLDIGFGGNPIVAHAICLDRREGHPERADYGEPWPTHLVQDADFLPQFQSGALDWVFSSHVLEDFHDTTKVLHEWLRVLKPFGHLILFLPDQPTYVKYCEKRGELPNQAHKHPDFGLEFVKKKLPMSQCKIVYERWPVPDNPYSFDLVVEKLWT